MHSILTTCLIKTVRLLRDVPEVESVTLTNGFVICWLMNTGTQTS
jgi:hypothetical protein